MVPGCERVAEFLEEVEEKENLGEKGLLEVEKDAEALPFASGANGEE
jgi:hypothetical protein